VLVSDVSSGYGDPLGGSPAEPYLGTFETEAECRACCGAQPNCTSYAWGNISTKGLHAWWHRCYGRHDHEWSLTPVRGSYVGRRFSVPPPPGPPPPVPPGVVSLTVGQGAPVNQALFGWDLEEWGSALNLSFGDTAGLALTEALHPGVLRYPSGTGSNIWDMRKGRYIPLSESTRGPVRATRGYTKWQKFYPWINSLPLGTFSAKSFLRGLGGKAKRTIWDLNVFLFNTSEACDQIRYISGLPGQLEPGVLLELGNELYISNQGLPFYPNSTAYADAMVPIVACARKLMPKAKIAACGGAGAWNEGLKPYFQRSPPLFDGLTHHNYSPRTETVTALPPGDQMSYVRRL